MLHDVATNTAVTQEHKTLLVGAYRALSGSTPEGAILAHDAVPIYVWAGSAEFTVVSCKTGVRFTYRVTAPKRSKPAPGGGWGVRLTREQSVASPLRFVSVVDDGAHFLGTCYLQDDGSRRYVHSQERSRLPADDTAVIGVRWLLERLAALPPDQVEVWHCGRCGRCGRKLTTPESLTLGIGPDCADLKRKKA